MSKMKTKKSAAKRFKRTGRGRLMHTSPGQNHASTAKNARRMRRLRQMKEVGGQDRKNVDKLLGHD